VLRVLSVALGAFILSMGWAKLGWLADSTPLVDELRNWWGSAPLVSRWYIDYFAMPAAPLFARLVPAAELAAGAVLVVGYRVRLAAALSFFMVLNFHIAMGVIFELSYLTNAYGPPVIGGLAALALGAERRLPYSLSR